MYSAEKHVGVFQPVTAIDGGPHAERTKALVCGRDWTAGLSCGLFFCAFCQTYIMVAAVMLCPNEIYVFGRPVHGTHTSMRKESMAVVEVDTDVNAGGRNIVLKAQSAYDSILLERAQLRSNSRVNTTIDILENAAVMQRRHVKYCSATDATHERLTSCSAGTCTGYRILLTSCTMSH